MSSLVPMPSKKKLSTLAKKKGLYIKTFGCQMNEYDSLKLEKILSDNYVAVDNPEDAQVILVNTCSVREKPEHKLYSLLGQLQKHKERDAEVLIGVGGCVAQQEGDTITKKNKNVDFVFGTHNLSLVPSLIERRKSGYDPQVAIDYRDEWEELPLGLEANGRVSVFISISRGCNKNCTYCIVPTTRGSEVSRSVDEILREARIAAHRGAKEVVLLGQTVNSYGRDFVPRKKFTELLDEISEIEGIKRIRFTSPHPQEVREDFFDLVERNPKVCRHIHMPLQAGSDSILKAMNRNYRKKRYRTIIEELKKRAPDIAISTDIIVGFPGETRNQFEETLEIMRDVKFDMSYSFVFSPRPGTPAALLEDPVPYEEKLEWLQELQALQESITSKKLEAMIGKRTQILLEDFSKSHSNRLQGRTSQNVLVHLDREEMALGPGMMVDVRILEASRHTLRGTFVEEAIAA